MSKKKTSRPDHPDNAEAAFVMEDGDRFHAIIVSDPVRFEMKPDAETYVTFFFIRRANGTFDLVHVMKTFEKDECVSRNVHVKKGIASKDIDAEFDNVRIGFAVAIETQTGFKMKWNTLDLYGIEDMKEQVLRIKAWDRVGVHSPLSDVSALPPGVNPN